MRGRRQSSRGAPRRRAITSPRTRPSTPPRGVPGCSLVCTPRGDNGASAEGTIHGTFNETLIFNGASALETVEFMASKVDLFGGPHAYNHYAVGWAHAMDTPYQWTKQVASH